MKFGIASRDITPERGMAIPGYFSSRFVSGILDNLYAKAMVFENEDNFFVSIVCDAITLSRDDVLRIRRGINEKCGISERNISVSASHTHTGGPVWSWGEAAKRNPFYIDMLVNMAVDAAEDAFKKRVPAKIGFAKSDVKGYSFIRRFEMKNGSYSTNPGIGNPNIKEPIGTPDESFVVGKVTDLNGKILAFISNFGVHLDMIGGNKVSADFPGVLSKLIKEKYGENVESIFFTGPCGNTNHVNQKPVDVSDATESGLPEDAPAYEKTGYALFNKLCEIEKGIVLSSDVKFDSYREFLSAKLRIPAKERVLEAQEFLRGKIDKFGYADWNARKLMATAAVEAYNNPIHMIDVEIMVLIIDDAAMVFWPGEVFVEYGKAVRKKFADKNIFIAELSNGSFECYLPTEEAIKQGGYEPTIASAFTPDVQIGTDMVNETIKQLDKGKIK